ncbi:hypothetical protein FQN54_006348 [Arachnomyces sp. PD_36]|nr:hypothetical protein FQN54_006348 [Arachnomyces sp. PD_36]
MDPSHHRICPDSSDDESVPLQCLPQPPGYNKAISTGADSGSYEGIAIKSTNPFEEYARLDMTTRDMRRLWRAILLLFGYLLLLVIPFPLTCVMIYRPLNLPSYIDFRSEYKIADFDYNYRAQVIVRVLNSIRAVATIPLVGVVLAQAAVIHAHKRAIKSQHLSLTELYRLADRGWTDPQHL